MRQDVLLDWLVEHPLNVLVCLLTAAGLYFSVVMLGMSLCVFVLLRWIRIPVWIPIGLGFLLVLGAWGFDGIFPSMVLGQNQFLWKHLTRANTQDFLRLFLWLSAFPYAVLLGALFDGLLKRQRSLQSEVKRVAQGRQQETNPTRSSAHLQRALQRFPQATMKSATVLGVNCRSGQSALLSDAMANLHTLFIGTTGSGKTTGLANIIESAIQREHVLFYVDGKGDRSLAERVGDYATSQGRPFYLFSMVGDSVKYNPIASGGFTSKKDRIIELRHWSEDHYRKLAESYLQTVFKVMAFSDITVDLYSLAQHLEDTALYQLVHDRKDPVLNAMIKTLKPKRASIESLLAEIETMAQSEIGSLFDCRSGRVLTLQKAFSEKAIVYFCLQPLTFPAYAETLGKLVINDLKALMATQLSVDTPPPSWAIFDEFSLFAGTQITHLINQGRGAGLHAVLSTQSLSDVIDKGGSALLGQILNNTNNYVIQRQNNPEDAEILANIIGTETSFDITSQVKTESNRTPTGSIRLTREFMMHPDEIKRLGLGEAIYLNKQPFQVQRIQLRKGQI